MSAVKAQASNTLFTNRTPSPSSIIANINNFGKSKENFQSRPYQAIPSNITQQYLQPNAVAEKNHRNLANLRWSGGDAEALDQLNMNRPTQQGLREVNADGEGLTAVEFEDHVPLHEQQKPSPFEFINSENGVERHSAQYNRNILHQNIGLIDADEVMKETTTDPILSQYSARKEDGKQSNHQQLQHMDQPNKTVTVYQNHQQMRHINQHNFDMNAAYAESPQATIESSSQK